MRLVDLFQTTFFSSQSERDICVKWNDDEKKETMMHLKKQAREFFKPAVEKSWQQTEQSPPEAVTRSGDYRDRVLRRARTEDGDRNDLETNKDEEDGGRKRNEKAKKIVRRYSDFFATLARWKKTY